MGRIHDITAFLAQTGEDAPTAAERQLVAYCQAGKALWLGDGKRPTEAHPDRTIRADLLRALILGGDKGCVVDTNGVILWGAWITGPLDLSFARAKGPTSLANCQFTESVIAMQTRFDLLNLSGSQMPGLIAQGAKVIGDVFLRNGFNATGEVSLSGASIGGQLDCSGGRFDHPTGIALKAYGVQVTGAVFLNNGFRATGQVDLSGASIGGQLACTKGRFDHPTGDALNAEGVQVTGDVFLNKGFHATGEVSLSGAGIGGQLDCTEGRFGNANGIALTAQRVRVTEGLFWWDVTIDAGRVIIGSAHVGDLVDDLASWPSGDGQLYLDGLTYDRIGNAFTDAPSRLDWLRRGTVWEGEFKPQPYSQLAKVLREMGHDSAARAVLVEQRSLLGQAARKARRQKPNGKPLLRFENPLVEAVNAGSGIVDFGSRWLVGYGYRPWNALWALLVLWMIALALASAAWREGSFAPNSDVILTSPAWTDLLDIDCIGPLPDDYFNDCEKNPADTWSASAAPGMDWDSFHSAAYAVDLVIPILNLGQTEAWAPSKDRGPWGWGLWWGRWLLIAAGWFVTTLGVAAVTGIIRRE